ncbi:hypothetical protein JXI42_13140 [bacterium]|nr:hypothetical protein [bacterium]
MKRTFCWLVIIVLISGWLSLLSAEPVAKPSGFSSSVDTVQIGEIQQDPASYYSVAFEGVVTLGADIIDTARFKAYIQDGSGYGILLFNYDFTAAMVSVAQRGNLLGVTGTVTEYYGVTEITGVNLTLIDSSQAIPAPETLSTVELNDPRWDGTLIYTEAMVTDVYSTGADYNVNIDDGSGETLIRVWSTANIPMETFETGHWYSIIGVGSVYIDYDDDTTYQVLVGYLDDIAELDTTPVDTIPEDITLISQIQADPSAFHEVTVEGVVTLGANIIDTSYFKAYIQDTSGYGIMLFDFDNLPDMITKARRGNLVRVKGTVEEYNAVTEITDLTITLLDSNVALPNPDTVSTEDLNDPRWEGTFVYTQGEVVDLYSTGNAFNAHLDDGSGDVPLRAWGTTGIPQSVFDLEHWYSVLGVGSIYIDGSETTYQVLLGYEEDISEIDTLSPVTPTSEEVKLTVVPKTFAPSLGESYPVTVNIPREAEVVIRIYDIHGRLVKTLFDESTSGLISIEWDGKNDYARTLTSGVYLCHLEVKEIASGDVENKLAPITVGLPLK